MHKPQLRHHNKAQRHHTRVKQAPPLHEVVAEHKQHDRECAEKDHCGRGRQLLGHLLPEGAVVVVVVEGVAQDPVEEDERAKVVEEDGELPREVRVEERAEDDEEEDGDGDVGDPAALLDCPRYVVGDNVVVVAGHWYRSGLF